MGINYFGIALVAGAIVVAPLAGCATEGKPVAESKAESTSQTEAESTADDEQQIRDLIDEELEAFIALDFDKAAELTCSKHREEVRKQADEIVPPVTSFELPGDPEIFREELTNQFKENFPNSSDATIDGLVDAVISQDQDAFKEAFLDAFGENFTVTLDSVENIEVDGDEATADITSTSTAASGETETKTESTSFVKEDGEWKDCSDPN